MELFMSTKPPTKAQAAKLAEVMPLLANQALEAPHFIKTNWKVNQKFRASDDPDRTQQEWVPPDFVCKEDPALQGKQTTAEELEVPDAQPDRRFARVVRQVLSEEKCAALIQHVNTKGFTPALLNLGRDVQTLDPYVRNGHRVIVDCPDLAAWLLEVLRPHLPEKLSDGSCLVDFNERLRFLCYTPGQEFEAHFDGRYQRPRGHQREGDMSRITVQLYLHDVPESCGGATTFFHGRDCSVKHQPEAGSVLLFTQDLLHEGSLVQEGIKYTLRTEVMYRRPAQSPYKCH